MSVTVEILGPNGSWQGEEFHVHRRHCVDMLKRTYDDVRDQRGKGFQ